MSISVGDKLPEANFTVMTDDGPSGMSTSDVFAGKKVAAFAVPGAFTPTCHLKHLPGFLDHLNDFKDHGVDTIACIAINDIFVLDAWAKNTGAEGKILFLADGNGDFTKAIGLEFDASAVGLGERSKRYAMLADDGVVKALNIEDAPASAIISSADELLKSL
jgi:peroxiredoxin